MTILNKSDLFYIFFDALRSHTESVLFGDGNNPYTMHMAGNDISVFLANVHFAGRSDTDEYRIQCHGSIPRILAGACSTSAGVFVVGYFRECDVFCAWDPARFLARSNEVQRFSIYTRRSKMRQARQEGLAVYTDSDGQRILAFRREFIGLYIENATVLHGLSEESLRGLSKAYGSAQTTEVSRAMDADAQRFEVEIEKRRVSSTSIKYVRNPRFRANVLMAYGHACAMCDIQLDLVDAAHIVPHAHALGVDSISNGMALCSLHHKSFDTGLLYVCPDYAIRENQARLEYLTKVGRVGGLQWYRDGLRSSLMLPRKDIWFPTTDNLRIGNQVRGIGFDH